MKDFVRMATARSVVVRALKISAVVGSILVTINQFDAIFGEGTLNWVKVLLTFTVPYCVATYAAVTALQERSG